MYTNIHEGRHSHSKTTHIQIKHICKEVTWMDGSHRRTLVQQHYMIIQLQLNRYIFPKILVEIGTTVGCISLSSYNALSQLNFCVASSNTKNEYGTASLIAQFRHRSYKRQIKILLQWPGYAVNTLSEMGAKYYSIPTGPLSLSGKTSYQQGLGY